MKPEFSHFGTERFMEIECIFRNEGKSQETPVTCRNINGKLQSMQVFPVSHIMSRKFKINWSCEKASKGTHSNNKK